MRHAFAIYATIYSSQVFDSSRPLKSLQLISLLFYNFRPKNLKTILMAKTRINMRQTREAVLHYGIQTPGRISRTEDSYLSNSCCLNSR